MLTGSISISSEIIKTVECEDGYRLQFRVWPAQGPPMATLVLINGIMSHSGWFRELAGLLAAMQINVVGADRRGSGLNHRDRGDARSRHVLLSDLRTVMLREERGVPVYLVGWCWGAVLAVNAALEFGSAVKGIVLLAPGLFPSEQINRAMRSIVTALQHNGTHSSSLKIPLTEDMFTDIPCFRDLIRADELAVRAFTPQFLKVSQKMMLVATARLPQLTHPVLLLLAGKDQAVDNKTTLAKFQRLRSAEVTVATLPHNHGLQFEAPREIARNISEWLARQGVPMPVPQNFL